MRKFWNDLRCSIFLLFTIFGPEKKLSSQKVETSNFNTDENSDALDYGNPNTLTYVGLTILSLVIICIVYFFNSEIIRASIWLTSNLQALGYFTAIVVIVFFALNDVIETYSKQPAKSSNQNESDNDTDELLELAFKIIITVICIVLSLIGLIIWFLW